ncbi:MAG: efflux RND transporter periplasmic adaptor subunit [Armatimonadetes bacterium]|nr:efflux RND transporter periplasmic adaptor subunit [Armatimonadota bacterium]
MRSDERTRREGGAAENDRSVGETREQAPRAAGDTTPSRRHPRPARLFVAAILVIAAALAGVRAVQLRPAGDRLLEASGTIETTEVNVASQVPGRVTQLLAGEGTEVNAGQVVARLDAAEMDTLLAQARATVEAARARVVQAEEALRAQRNQTGAVVAQAQATVDVSRARVAQAEEALRAQRNQADAMVAQANAQAEAARTRVPQTQVARDWQAQQVTQQVDQASAQVAAAERAVEAARANVEAIEANLARAALDMNRAEALFRDGAIPEQQVDAARALVRALRAQRDAAAAQEAAAARQVQQAQAALRAAEANSMQVEIRQQETAIAGAQARQAEAGVQAARVAYDLVRQRQQEVTAARAALVQAQAGVRVAQVGYDVMRQREQDVAAARAALAQAEATLARVQVLYDHTILRAPMAGLVLTKNVEVGDVVAAGQRLLVIARLDQVWLRVFIPEADLARVRVGQPAEVFVDAFRGRAFPGTVTQIGQQAEFTPRNVQTREERVKLVFAVKVTVPNPDHLLKPGMPADTKVKAVARAQEERR